MALFPTVSYECQGTAGYAHLTAINGPGASYSYTLTRLSDGAVIDTSRITRAGLPLDFDNLYDDGYELRLVDESDPSNSGSAEFNLACGYPNPGGQPGGLLLDSLTHTDETAARDDGTATIQASGGVPPLTATIVELSLSRPATAGQPSIFPHLPPSKYTVRVTDSSPTPQVVGGVVTVLPYVAPVAGCQDEYADNYDPLATTGGSTSCLYTPTWRSAWGPAGLAVRVPALPGQTAAYVVAELRLGFRPGHPLAAARPLGAPLKLQATVAPDGYATFRLGPYLWPALGVEDGQGGYRLDLNSPTASTADLFTGYELRRATGGLLEHGYALNAAVPDAALRPLLSPFDVLPLWAGFEEYAVPTRVASAVQFATITTEPAYVSQYPMQYLPCPSNPLPVAWLAPGGGFGYWVFSGRPQVGDEVGESQSFTEPASGQRRYSQRGAARGTITASSGVFSGPQFGEGLRTLWASPQVWYQPVAGGEWVAVTLEGGSFPVRRIGLPRTEFSLTFTEAVPHYAQGQ